MRITYHPHINDELVSLVNELRARKPIVRLGVELDWDESKDAYVEYVWLNIVWEWK